MCDDDWDAPKCDNCHDEKPTRTRRNFRLCGDCVHIYDQSKKAANAARFSKQFTPDARLFVVFGTAYGEVGTDDIGELELFKITRRKVEGVCIWCAIRQALMSVDPWAFQHIFSMHGEYEDHDVDDIRDNYWLIRGGLDNDHKAHLEIIDMGEVEPARWWKRLGPRYVWKRLIAA